MGRIRVASRGPADWRPGLADPDRQWREGFSAFELARAWDGRDDFPPAVQSIFAAHPLLADAELLIGLPEYRVSVPGRGHSSQVDLLVLARGGRPDVGLVVIAVEGKVNETFGPRLDSWRRERSDNREKRLRSLCGELGLEVEQLPGDLRYQLLHRAVSALEAARLFAAHHAVLLVHSFSLAHTGYADFERFAALLGVVVRTGAVSRPLSLGNIDLSMGWVADDLPSTDGRGSCDSP